MQIKDIRLRDATPSDKPHLLLWDKFDQQQLQLIATYENAQVVSYRQNLLSRISPNSSYLSLQQDLDPEFRAIRQICDGSSKKIVILRDLDCLITYLQSHPESRITLFWHKLFYTRQLESTLWISLPSKLAPPMWTSDRLKQV
jgi:hypothetical protein